MAGGWFDAQGARRRRRQRGGHLQALHPTSSLSPVSCRSRHGWWVLQVGEVATASRPPPSRAATVAHDGGPPQLREAAAAFLPVYGLCCRHPPHHAAPQQPLRWRISAAAQIRDLDAVAARLILLPSLACHTLLYDCLSTLHIVAANGRIEVLSMILYHRVPLGMRNRHQQVPIPIKLIHGVPLGVLNRHKQVFDKMLHQRRPSS
ncbi:unnamed protein product [Urochloa humidicola]